MSDWLEEHVPPRVADFLIGAWFRITGRCIVCDRLMVKHSPWALYICERTPLPIEITDQGRAWVESRSVDPAA
jgi:hypothetical protein